MSRKHKHARLNPPPNISMFGSSLDRLLNGVVTSELAKELDRGTSPLPSSAESTATPFTPKPTMPVYAVFYSETCACGNTNHRTYGYMARKHVVAQGNGIDLATWETVPDGPWPDGIRVIPRLTPFCVKCIPTGLNRE